MEDTPASRPYLELADMAARKAKLQEKVGKSEPAASPESEPGGEHTAPPQQTAHAS